LAAAAGSAGVMRPLLLLAMWLYSMPMVGDGGNAQQQPRLNAVVSLADISVNRRA